MPKIPVLQPSVSPRPVEAPVPQVLRPPEEAFGGEVQAAKAGLAQQVQKTSDLAFRRLVEIRQRDDEQNALDTITKFQTDLQNKLNDNTVDESGKPKGYLQRQLGQARGSVPEFDATAQELKKQYMDTVMAPELKTQVQKTLDVHLTTAREQVLHHEANQREQDFRNSLDANIKTNIAAAASISHPLAMLDSIKAAQAAATGGYMHLGMDPQTVEVNNRALAGEMVKSSVLTLIEQDPKKAQDMLNVTRGTIPANAITELQKTIDGKMIHEKQLDTWNVVSNFKLSDGMVDTEKAVSYIMKMPLQADEKEQVLHFVHGMISVSNSELHQQREATDRSFTNDLVTQQSKGLPYQDALLMAAKYGRDATDIADKQNTVTELYTGKQNAFDTWIHKQPEATQAAWAYAEETIKGKYGTNMGTVPGYPNSVKLADAAINELKQGALGKTPDQIRQLVNDKLKEVAVGPGLIWRNIWPSKDQAWKVDAGVRQGLSTAVSQLEKDYGVDHVSQARQFLIRNQQPITPRNLKAVLDTTVNKDKGDAQ